MKKKVIFSLIVVLLGVGLAFTGNVLGTREREAQLGIQLYNDGWEAYQAKNFKDAAALFVQAGTSTKNAELEAKALYNLATLAWQMHEDPDTVIGFYQTSLRKNPDFYEAGFNLELFYELLHQIEIQSVGSGEGEEGEDDTSGDI